MFSKMAIKKPVKKNYAMIRVINQRRALAKQKAAASSSASENPSSSTNGRAAPINNKRRRPVEDGDDEDLADPVENARRRMMDDNTGDVELMDMAEGLERDPARLSTSASANGTGGGMRGQALIPPGIRDKGFSGTREYTKQYTIRVFNQADEVASYSNANESGSKIRYPYHDLPVGLLGFYLTRDEIKELFSTTTKAVVRECHVQLANKTAVLYFETNATTTTVGNNNVGVYLVTMSPDLAAKRYGLFETKEYNVIQDVFWGDHIKDIKPTGTDWTTANVGKLSAAYVNRNYTNRFEYMQPDSFGPSEFPRSTQYWPHAFNIRAFIKQRINSSMNEGVFEEWSYSPREGIICGQFRTGPNMNPSVAAGTGSDLFLRNHAIGHRPYASTNKATNIQQGRSTIETNTLQVGQLVTNVFQNTFETDDALAHLPIENCFVSGEFKEIPNLTFGIEPLMTTKSLTDPSEIVKTYVDIIINVKCVIDIKSGNDYTFPYSGSGQIMRPNTCNPPMATYEIVNNSGYAEAVRLVPNTYQSSKLGNAKTAVKLRAYGSVVSSKAKYPPDVPQSNLVAYKGNGVQEIDNSYVGGNKVTNAVSNTAGSSNTNANAASRIAVSNTGKKKGAAGKLINANMRKQSIESGESLCSDDDDVVSNEIEL